MIILTIVFAITGIFGECGPTASGSSPPKEEGALKKLLNKLAECPQRTCW